jgi:hypothetical protein
VARSARRLLAGAGAVALVVGLSACAPGTPDGDSWRIDAQRSVSDTAAEVHAAELALRLRADDRIFDNYLQTVLVDAEAAVGSAGSAVGGIQPPRAERERSETVTGQIGAAEELLTAARVAVVDGENDRYEALADRLAAAGEALARLEKDLQHPPAAGGG